MSNQHTILHKALLDRGWTQTSDKSYEITTTHQHTALVIRNDNTLTIFYRTPTSGGSTYIKATTPALRAAREATRIAH